MDNYDQKASGGLEHLTTGRQRTYNPIYSRMIRWLRFALPLAALAIAAVVFTWDGRESMMIREASKEIRRTVGKNELINPRFENTDAENRPYTLTAKRAVQDNRDGEVVILEKPLAAMTLTSGDGVALEASEGAFQQEQRKLLLRGDVKLSHDGGYQLETPELHIDIKNSTAMSDKDVYAHGPEGTLVAKGLEGRNKDGILIFKGPAKLVLKTDQTGGLLQ